MSDNLENESSNKGGGLTLEDVLGLGGDKVVTFITRSVHTSF